MTLAAWARSRGVTKQRAWQWAKRGRIAGAVKRGGRWDVPPDAPVPARISYGGRPRRKLAADSLANRNETA